jgi:hypothetical protein
VPRDEKNFKRQIRARMTKSGESYTTARAQLEAQSIANSSEDTAATITTEGLLELSRTFPTTFPRVQVASASRWYGQSQRAPDGSAAPSPTSLPSDPIVRTWSGETWMEFDATVAWRRPQQVAPVRWRENGVHEGKGANDNPTTSVLNGATHWEDGPNGLVRHDAPESTWGFDASWVCNPFWNAHLSDLHLESIIEVIGRRAAVVLVTPTRASNIPSDLYQRVTVDLDSGLGLAYANFRLGRVLVERAVSAISFPAAFPDELFELPKDRVVTDRQPRRTYERIADAAPDVPFPILVPAVLPGDVRLGRIDVVEPRSGGVILHFMYHSTHASPPLSVSIDEDSPSRENSWAIDWKPYERGDLTLLVSDTSPEARQRAAQLAIGPTRVTLQGFGLTFDELIGVASSLRPADQVGNEAETMWPAFGPQGGRAARDFEVRRAPIEEVAAPDDPASIAGQFQLRCRELVTETRELGFNPNVWVAMINEIGALPAAKKLLADHHILVATPWLVDRGRPDLTLEHEIGEPRWRLLFSDEDRAEATTRLNSPGDWPRRRRGQR